MNKPAIFGICGVGLALLFAANTYFFPSDPVVVSYNGGTIRQSELDRALEDEFGADMIRELTTKRLVAQSIANNHLALSDVDLDLWVEEYKLRPDVQELVATGQLNVAKLRENLRTSVPLYYLALQNVSENEREKFFEEHRAQFEQLDLSHILLGSKEEALQLRQRITSPESFATMAIVYSLDDRNRDFSGALGRVTRAELASSFADEDVQSLFKMTPGTVSRPMKAEGSGWHLFLVKKRLTDYASLKRQVVATMAEPKLAECLGKLRDDAQVEVLWQPPKAFAAPSPSPSSIYTDAPKPNSANPSTPMSAASTVPSTEAPKASATTGANPAPTTAESTSANNTAGTNPAKASADTTSASTTADNNSASIPATSN